MQQFASAARNQARTPPIALTGWMKQQEQQPPTRERMGSSTRQLSSIATTDTLSPSTGRRNTRPFCNTTTSASDAKKSDDDRCDGADERTIRRLLTTKTLPTGDNDEESEEEIATIPEADSQSSSQELFKVDRRLAESFHRLLLTRRTTSQFRTRNGDEHDLLTAAEYRAAIERAVLAGRAAPNHKRTEPFTFKQMLSPSTATERLAEIAAQVQLRRENLPDREQAAERKRQKWKEIPAFLVTLVASSTPQYYHLTDDLSAVTTDDPYEPSPFVGPSTERELEDYAAACAATQSILLSLHAEGIATKWATGLVVRTAAFRELIRAKETERVVGLILIGQAKTGTKPRRYRRELHGDVLQKL
jgi:nitroreductase